VGSRDAAASGAGWAAQRSAEPRTDRVGDGNPVPGGTPRAGDRSTGRGHHVARPFVSAAAHGAAPPAARDGARGPSAPRARARRAALRRRRDGWQGHRASELRRPLRAAPKPERGEPSRGAAAHDNLQLGQLPRSGVPRCHSDPREHQRDGPIRVGVAQSRGGLPGPRPVSARQLRRGGLLRVERCDHSRPGAALPARAQGLAADAARRGGAATRLARRRGRRRPERGRHEP